MSEPAVNRCGKCGETAPGQPTGQAWRCFECADAEADHTAREAQGSYVPPSPLTAEVTFKPRLYLQDIRPTAGVRGEGRPDSEVYLREWEAGRMQPLPFAYPSPPPNAPRTMLRVLAFYCLVRGLLLEACDDSPVWFGSAWVAPKLGPPTITDRTVSRVLDRLVKAETLVRGPDERTPAGRMVYTYLPGPPAPPERLQVLEGGAHG